MRRFSLLLILAALSISGTTTLVAAPVKLPHLSCDNSSNVPNTDLLAYDFAVQVNPSPNGTNTSSRPTPNLVVTLAPGTDLIQLTKLVAGSKHVPICTLSSAGLLLSLRDVNFLKLEVVAITDPATNKTTNTVQLTLTYDAEQTFQSL